MGELKQHQPSMSVDKQVENLKALGLIMNDEEYAKRILNDIQRKAFKDSDALQRIFTSRDW